MRQPKHQAAPPQAKGGESWPRVITGVFIVFFAGLVAFIVFANRHSVDLVQADYYEQEIQYQHRLDRVNRTLRAGQPMAVNYDGATRHIVLRLAVAESQSVAGQIHLYRPSNAQLDQQIPLALDAQGIQKLDSTRLRPGLWKVRVEWQVGGEGFYIDQPIVVPAAGA
ncbi:MAG: FixH family protein [Verrucomicrobiota bacterium]